MATAYLPQVVDRGPAQDDPAVGAHTAHSHLDGESHRRDACATSFLMFPFEADMWTELWLVERAPKPESILNSY